MENVRRAFCGISEKCRRRDIAGASADAQPSAFGPRPARRDQDSAPCGERLRGPAPKIPASLFKKGLTQNLVFPCEFGLANFFQMRYNKDMARNCALTQSGSIRKWQLRGAVLASRPSKRLHIVNRAPYATASCTAPLLYNIFQCFARGGRHAAAGGT